MDEQDKEICKIAVNGFKNAHKTLVSILRVDSQQDLSGVSKIIAALRLLPEDKQYIVGNAIITNITEDREPLAKLKMCEMYVENIALAIQDASNLYMAYAARGQQNTAALKRGRGQQLIR